MSKKTIIVGAGLAGLSTGIYLQQKGIETEIYELAPWAGGVCTAWVRNGYRFDGCIHWMVGTKPGDGFYELYREVDALKDNTQIYNADYIDIEIDGEMFEIPMHINEFKDFLLSVSPQDKDRIEALCRDIETMANSKMPTGMPSKLTDAAKVLWESRGFLNLARKYLGITVKEYVKNFESSKMRSILFSLMPEDFSAEALIMMLGTRMGGNAGYPIGGALEVIKGMEKKYISLGGKIFFNSRVDEIIVENGKTTAIKSKGIIHQADAVVAACDAYDTLKNMLDGKYSHPQFDTMLKSAPLFPPLAIVSFGLNRKFDIPFSIQYECPKGIKTSPDTTEYSLGLRSFDFDPSAAPENCSSTMVMVSAPLEYWNDLREKDMDEYRKQKQQLADNVADAIEERIPGFKESIVVTDISTPATYVRLVNLYKASFEGFAPTPELLKTNIKKTIPGINNLFICGQWTAAGGGICSAISSGKDTANLVSKLFK